ncbi:MAG: hypothetical protein U0892_02450 [Pirellulales bacterium]
MSAGRGSYSLGLLFYITTLAAIFVAGCRYLFDSETATWIVLALSTGGFSILGFFIGLIAGLRSGRLGLGALIGMIVGTAAGVPAGLAATIDIAYFGPLMFTIFAGCWGLMTVTLVFDRLRHQKKRIAHRAQLTDIR